MGEGFRREARSASLLKPCQVANRAGEFPKAAQPGSEPRAAARNRSRQPWPKDWAAPAPLGAGRGEGGGSEHGENPPFGKRAGTGPQTRTRRATRATWPTQSRGVRPWPNPPADSSARPGAGFNILISGDLGGHRPPARARASDRYPDGPRRTGQGDQDRRARIWLGTRQTAEAAAGRIALAGSDRGRQAAEIRARSPDKGRGGAKGSIMTL